MVVDFRRRRTATKPIIMTGEEVGAVEPYEYRMPELLYQSVAASAVYCAVVCRESSICARCASGINQLTHGAGTVTGQNLAMSESLGTSRSLDKLLPIMDNPSHPLPGHTTDSTFSGNRSSRSHGATADLWRDR